MQEALVYFIDMRASAKENLFSKIKKMLKKAGFYDFIKEGELVAVKIHFGEAGNLGYIHPRIVKEIINEIKKKKAKPFLTDTNTIYVGSRTNAVDHINTAISNGFAYACVGAPIIIADGLRGFSGEEVEINLKHYKSVTIGKEILEADKIVCLTHFKGHEVSGFGGAIKNIGMGCATRSGKLSMHSKSAPYITKKCKGCKLCIKYCPASAIFIENKKAKIDEEKCYGCGYCLGVCPEDAIKMRWDESTKNIQEKICEHAYAVLKVRKKETFFMNFIINVSPACDCYSHTDRFIVPDIGICASYDIIAIDQASADLVNKEQGIKGTALKKAFKEGEDKFKDLYPEVDWSIQLKYGEEIGLGTRKYKLVKL